jgi:hypothetical protein
LSFGETLQALRACHRAAPFLFFNGNTFAELARQATTALMAEFGTARRREAASLAAHFVAGVLDWEPLRDGLSSLREAPDFKPDDGVRTFRGSLTGRVIRVLPDGRIAFRADATGAEMIATPESLLRRTPRKQARTQRPKSAAGGQSPV